MILRFVESSRLFLIVLLLGTLVLLMLVASEFGGALPDRETLTGRPNSVDPTEYARRMESLISSEKLMALRLATNSPGLFFTAHFQPPPPLAATNEVPPAKPATKKIQITYQGFYQAATGEKKAFLKLGETSVTGIPGATVVADWTIAEIAVRSVTLQNAAAQTNLFEFNVPKEIEVPNP